MLPTTPQNPKGTGPATIPLETLQMVAGDMFRGRQTGAENIKAAAAMLNAELQNTNQTAR